MPESVQSSVNWQLKPPLNCQFNAGIGPILGELAAQTTSELAVAGSILTFLFLGSLIAQIFAGPLTDRFGQNLIFIISMVLFAAGVIGFTTARSLPLMLGLVFIAGMGQGGLDLGANLIVSAAFPKNNTAYLNLLHFFFGFGAFAGPALVGFAMRSTGSGKIIQWIAAGIFIFMAGITLIIQHSIKKVPGGTPESAPSSQGMGVYLSPLLWVMGGLLLVYVGIEYGLGSWATRYMNITTGMAKQNGALVTSAYWGALTLGRLAGSAASRRLSRLQLLSIALIGSMLGVVGVALSMEKTILTIFFIAWTGFSFGTVYPTSMALVVAAFPESQGKSVGVLAAMGSIGGLLLPWMEGVLLEKVSPLSYTLFLTGCGAVLLLLVLGAHKLRKTQTAEVI
jgi:fucose permease